MWVEDSHIEEGALISAAPGVYTISGLDYWTGLLDCPFTLHMRNCRSVAAYTSSLSTTRSAYHPAYLLMTLVVLHKKW